MVVLAGESAGDGDGRLTVAAVFREFWAGYCERYRPTAGQRRVAADIMACRTATLGGQVAACDRCGVEHFFYYSCRNRHCPQCQGLAKAQWLAQRQRELLPIPYFHTVFTLDHVWNGLLYANQRVLYSLLFALVSQLLKEYGQRYLGGEIGVLVVLHTWAQNLEYHVHLHCIVTGGALTAAGQWQAAQKDYLFPVVALSADFRQRFCAGLRRLYRAGRLDLPAAWEAATFATNLQTSQAKKWEVYIKPPFGGPERVLDYLGGYVNRIAISNHRLVKVAAGQVYFRYRQDEAQAVMHLEGVEFIRRFLGHVLPAGFVRIRYYGLWHPNQRAKLQRCRTQLQLPAALPVVVVRTLAEWVLALTGQVLDRCPACQTGRLVVVRTLPVLRPQLPYRRRRASCALPLVR